MIKNLVLTVLFLLLLAQSIVALSPLQKPETIVFDSLHNRYLVSNWDSGNIVMIDSIGNYSIFYSGLASTAGLHIHDNILYVGSNFGTHNGLVGIDLETRQEVYYNLPVGCQFTNDITTDTSGNLYFTDTNGSRIYRIRLSDNATSIFVSVTIHWPNGIHFDARNNRLLVAHNNPNTPVKAVDVVTGVVTDATTSLAEWDGFGEDNLHNLYVSYSDGGTVYRFDSILTNPGVIVSSGHNVPEGIDFDNLHSMLLIPNMFANTISFKRMNVDLWAEGDTLGWTPFEVQFDGHSVFDIAEWTWDFGDGNSAFVQSPIHTYDVPGQYDVTLQAVTISDDTLRHTFPHYIAALGDTLRAGDYEIAVMTPSEIEVAIYASTSHPLREMTIPVEYSGTVGMVYDTFTTQGCRTEGFTQVKITSFSPSTKQMTFSIKPIDGTIHYMMPGDGPVLKMKFSASGWFGAQTPIMLDGYGAYLPKCYGNAVEYAPATSVGYVTVAYICGNANADLEVNVGDAVHLINCVFKGGPLPDPVCVGDANGDGGVNVGDAVYLIAYVFKSGPAPVDNCCP